MFTLTGKNAAGHANLVHADVPAELAHYLRQATITRRRQSSRINYLWCKNQLPPNAPHPWKH